MKKNHRIVSILAIFVFSITQSYALDGYAVVSLDRDLVSASIALDEKVIESNYPLNSRLVIINTETNAKMIVTVVKGIANASRLAEIPQDVAKEIGIEIGSGRITLLTLPEAETYGHIVSSAPNQATAVSQPVVAAQNDAVVPPKGSEVIQTPPQAPASVVSQIPTERPQVALPVLVPQLTRTQQPNQTNQIADSPVVERGPETTRANEVPSVTTTTNTPETTLSAETPRVASTTANSNTAPQRSAPWDENSELSLVPSDNRPPARTTNTTRLPAEAEVAPIVRRPEPESLPPSAQVTAIPQNSVENLPQNVEVQPITQANGLERLPPETEIALIAQRPAQVAVIPQNNVENLPQSAEAQAITQTNRLERLPPEAEIAPIVRSSPTNNTTSSSNTSPTGNVGNNPRSVMTINNSERETTPAAAVITPPPSQPSGPTFSVPTINDLEKGKYYVQLAALSRSDLVESELSRLGNTYPLTVQLINNSEVMLYRILLGPVNLGESGALLQRFRGIGYRDAFIRQGS